MEKITLVLLLSECFTFSACFLREYHIVYENLSWTEAQIYCKKTYTDLATIQNESEMNHLLHNVSSAGLNSDFWIGLYTTIDWKWSDGYTAMGAEYRNWENETNEPDFYFNEFCVSIKSTGTWFADDCSAYRQFICNKGTQIEPVFVIVEEPMDWFSAQTFCRKNYTDMATIKNKTENEKVKSLISSGNYAWIGLIRDPNLFWSDGSNFSHNAISGPNIIGSLNAMCGITSMTSKTWKFVSCENKRSFACYNIPSVKRNVVQLRMKGHELHAVKEELLKKLRDRLEKNGVTGVTLKWRERCDGQVFQKEKNTEP